MMMLSPVFGVCARDVIHPVMARPAGTHTHTRDGGSGGEWVVVVDGGVSWGEPVMWGEGRRGGEEKRRKERRGEWWGGRRGGDINLWVSLDRGDAHSRPSRT